MPRLDWLKQRAREPELMDDFSLGGEELNEALQHLRLLNRIFAAAGPTLYGVRQLWAEKGKPSRLSLLDVGAGSGDVNRRLLRWADQNRVELSITLVDITEEACEEARRQYAQETRVKVIRQNLLHLPDEEADIVTASQFVHHFDGEELAAIVGKLLSTSRWGVVINDIHRHWIAWSAVWLVTRCISRNRYIRHDGPLSVAKGFRGREWEQLEQALDDRPGFLSLDYDWRPLFRYAVIISKKQSDSRE